MINSVLRTDVHAMRTRQVVNATSAIGYVSHYNHLGLGKPSGNAVSGRRLFTLQRAAYFSIISAIKQEYIKKPSGI